MNAADLSALADAAGNISAFTARDGVFALALLVLFAAPALVFWFVRNGLLQSGADPVAQQKIVKEYADYLRVTRYLAAVLTLAAGGFWIYKETAEFNRVVDGLRSAAAEHGGQMAQLREQVSALQAENEVLRSRAIVIYGTVEGLQHYDILRVLSMDPLLILNRVIFNDRPIWYFAVILTSAPEPGQELRMLYECVPTVPGVACEIDEAEIRVALPERVSAGHPISFEFLRGDRMLRPRRA